MVINKTKLELTMAEALINPKELAEKAQISYPAFKTGMGRAERENCYDWKNCKSVRYSSTRYYRIKTGVEQ